ncbi:hypothetical protein QA584_08845 [Anaerocolumna sp. AGMB13025]|uniref:DUF6550 family protein n=1 Tax=Anaerocolumna sp. AGMB13025 TaxID=3039116 RepID=UPI00241DC015|nr:DUF6550 family protein [Anaerocolumna sp. AGMB13025]WFR59175.1 hypothetical protein QA584_08845 [Anaerocolumna sp. AGMB13025]
MKKDYSTKKKAAIAALSIVAVCLAGGLFYYIGTMGGQPQETPVESTAPVESQVVVPEIKPEATPKIAQTESNTSEADPSKTPAEPSQETAAPAGTENPQSKLSDGKPKSPTEATPPSDSPAETNQGSGNSSNSTQEQTQPQGGEKQDGKIYVPGFGWIDDEGGGSDVHEAPNAGTGEPVGDM